MWPWLLQMGAGRAGWYSYDFLDNGGRASARELVPELQEVHLGTIMPAMPGVTDGFTVLCMDPERSLTIGWVPGDGAPPMMTWSFVLQEPRARITRLIVRARGSNEYRPPFGLPRWTATSLMRWIHFVMQRKQLLGIADRAESRHCVELQRSPSPAQALNIAARWALPTNASANRSTRIQSVSS